MDPRLLAPSFTVGLLALIVASAGLVACAPVAPGTLDCGETEAVVEDAEGEETCVSDDGVTGDPDPSGRATADCRAASSLTPGNYGGTLFNADEDEGGACGLGGPDAFLRVAVAARADVRATATAEGFTPRVELRGDGCPGGTALACGLDGDAAVARNVPAGVELLVVIGIDPESPALQGGTAASLAFDVRVEATPVLEEGDVCRPPELGRCVDGTACVGPIPDGPPAAYTCQEVPGDACGGTMPSVSVTGDGTTTVDVPSSLGDTHQLGCDEAATGGAELALALELDANLGVEQTLRIDAADVRLAVRSPWCDASAEIACVEPGAGPLDIPGVGELAARGERPVLLMEWEADADLPAMVDVELSLVTP